MTSVAELVEHLLTSLGDTSTRVLVLRNYEGYPRHVTGDVDFLVGEPSDELWQAVDTLLERHGWVVAQLLDRPWVRSYTIFNHNADRPYFVLDFFLDTSWYTFPYLSARDVFESSESFASFLVPNIRHECYITLVHDILYIEDGVVPVRYRQRLTETVSAERAFFSATLAHHFGTQMATRLIEAVQTGTWEEIPKLQWRLRAALLQRKGTVSRAWCMLKTMPSLLLTRRFPGVAVVVREGKQPASVSPGVNEVVDLLKRTHLYRRMRHLQRRRRQPRLLRQWWLRAALRRAECAILWQATESDLTWLSEKYGRYVEVVPSDGDIEFRVRGVRQYKTNDAREAVSIWLAELSSANRGGHRLA